MAAFILMAAFRKRSNYTVAWANEATSLVVIPTADIKRVSEQLWGKGEDFDRRKAEYALANPEGFWEDQCEWASSGAESTPLTTIRLRSGERVPVIHSVTEVQNAANSVLGRI